MIVTVQGVSNQASAAPTFSYPPVITQITPTDGPEFGGTVITIFGANFATAANLNTVTIGDLVAIVESVSIDGTHLVVVTPAGSGSKKTVKVSVNGLTNAESNAALFDYDPPS